MLIINIYIFIRTFKKKDCLHIESHGMCAVFILIILIIATRLLEVILLPEEFEKKSSSLCVFIIFCIKMALVTY